MYHRLRRNPVRSTVGAIVAITVVSLGLGQVSDLREDEARIRVEPSGGSVPVGEQFTKHVIVESSVATNVFAGEVHFDPAYLEVASISYNTSIANLWAESPWFSRGDGVVYFAGGTTAPGGFTGSGILLSITYEARQAGQSSLTIEDARVLQHDGLGNELARIETPIDEILATTPDDSTTQTLFRSSVPGTSLSIVAAGQSLDLSGDGEHSIRDVSIFMQLLLTQNSRADFNGDGTVNLTDLSMLMNRVNN